MTQRGWESLSWLEKICQPDQLKALLHELPSHDAEFTLICAASRGDNVELVKALLAMDVSPNTTAYTSLPPVYACAILDMPNCVEIARLLLKAGADPDVTLNDGTFKRPLVHLATSRVGERQITIAKELIRFGAAPVKKHERVPLPCQPWYLRAHANMAACLLAILATELALTKRGLHKDVIPLVSAIVWETRLGEEWDIGA